MSGRPSPRRRSDALTGDLFGTNPTPLALPGSMDFRRAVAALISAGLKKAEGSRYAVSARMSELADVETSKALLDSYTAESRDESNLPLWKAPVYGIAANDRSLAEWHVGVLGGRVLWGREIADAEVGRCQRQIAELQEQIKSLKQMQRGCR